MENEPKRPIWPLALIAVGAIALYLYSAVEVVPQSSSERSTGGAAEIAALADRDDTNVLFILVDTLRADRMSAYGYERDTTPFISKLASKGIRFDRHIAQSSWTKTSMASMWSGLNPIRSGVTKYNHTLSSELTMPAEILSEAGLMTVGLFRNGWVSGYFGFDQGFDKYYRPAGTPHGDAAARRMRPNVASHGGDEDLIADAIEFLRIHGKSSRWMLYLHLMDLHEYTYDEESALFGSEVSDLYDNSIRRTDWVLSTLYDYLETSGLTDETIVVLLSDHGEAFGERGFEGHARSVYPETTETPLIISLPFDLEEGGVVADKTTNIDVWPTLLELLGLRDQGALDGAIDGRSRMPELRAALARERAPRPAADFSVAFLDETWGRPGVPRKPAISIIEGDYRFLSGTNDGANRIEVLLSIEDGQRTNRIDEFPEIADRLREEAERQLALEPEYSSDTIELDEMQLNQLRALGYELP